MRAAGGAQGSQSRSGGGAGEGALRTGEGARGLQGLPRRDARAMALGLQRARYWGSGTGMMRIEGLFFGDP